MKPTSILTFLSEHKTILFAPEFEKNKTKSKSKVTPSAPEFDFEDDLDFEDLNINPADVKEEKLRQYLQTLLAAGVKKNSIAKVYTASLLLFDLPEDHFMSASTFGRRIKALYEKKTEDHAEESTELVNISHDGRKDLTLQANGRLEREHHLTFVGDEGEYLNHCTMKDNVTGEELRGTAVNVSKKILEVLEDTNSLESVTFISSDGEPTNTGPAGKIELDLQYYFKFDPKWHPF